MHILPKIAEEKANMEEFLPMAETYANRDDVTGKNVASKEKLRELQEEVRQLNVQIEGTCQQVEEVKDYLRERAHEPSEFPVVGQLREMGRAVDKEDAELDMELKRLLDRHQSNQ